MIWYCLASDGKRKKRINTEALRAKGADKLKTKHK